MLQKRPNCFLFQISLPKYLKSQKERFRAIFDQINSIPGLNDPPKSGSFFASSSNNMKSMMLMIGQWEKNSIQQQPMNLLHLSQMFNQLVNPSVIKSVPHLPNQRPQWTIIKTMNTLTLTRWLITFLIKCPYVTHPKYLNGSGMEYLGVTVIAPQLQLHWTT
jgi:hypothetical protein